jgi:4-hydroxy-tetrahydrodipicolinate reductase
VPPVRVAVYGLGRVGQQAAALVGQRPGLELVATIRRSDDAARVLEGVRPEVMLHATVPSLADALPQLLLGIQAGARVVSTCEELAYPWVVHRADAERLDREARQAGVAVLGTGVNPGYVFDALVLHALAPRWNPERIEVSRVTDASGFGPVVRGRLGLGLDPADFRAMTADRRIGGHVGFRESMDLCAAAMGTRLEAFRETFEPMLADRQAAGVTPGQTAGFEQRASGSTVEGLPFDFRIVVHLWPAALGIDVADTVTILDGGQSSELRVWPACAPVETTAAQLVNVVPWLLQAEPGLRTPLDLSGPAPWVAWRGQ